MRAGPNGSPPRRPAPSASPRPTSGGEQLDNPYLKRVDAPATDPQVRAVIRQVQPACVRLNNASGVNIAAEGYVLTAAHVPGRLGAKMTAQFPDGRRYTATCVAFNAKLDLAVCTLATEAKLPFAPLAKEPPEAGSWVTCIGQPGATPPRRPPTAHKPPP